MKKKMIALLMTGLLAAACIAGCGSTEGTASNTADSETTQNEDAAADEAKADAEMAQSDTEEAAEVRGKATIWVWTSMQDEIDAYEASHPGTEIEQVIVEAGDYLTKIQTTLASGGELPDLVWGEILSRGQLYAMDILEDLSADPYNVDTSLVQPQVLESMKTEDGRIVGVEMNLNPSGLAYHRGLAKQYLGTDDPDEVSAMLVDWDAFIEIGKKVKEDSNGKVTMFTSLGDVYYIINGQSDSARISNGVINKAAVQELFTTICKFRDAGIVGQIDQWSPAWYASFAAEDSLFSPMPSYAEATWLRPNAPDGEGDWALIVPPEGGFAWGGNAMSITKDSQNKALAWDFLQYICFGEGADIRYRNGEFISKTGFYEGDILEEEDPYFGGQKITKIFIEDILSTVETHIPTQYDYADICTMEVVLSSLNTDYSMTPEQATEEYITEMQNQASELIVE